MKPKVKLLSAFLLLIILLSFALFPAISISAKSVYELESKSAKRADAIYFYCYNTKSVLFSKNEEKSIYPASTVKIMTGLIACERLSLRLDERMTVTKEMLEGCAGITMGLKAGDVLTVRDIIYCAICGGYNDACQVLAVICSGSLESFVEEMNLYAFDLGMNSTVYKNPTGLDQNGACTTISDIALLSKKAVKNPLYIEISSAKNYSYKNADGKDSVIYNKNALISHFTSNEYLNNYARGLIAGSTEKGGYVVSTHASYEGMEYLCIVMGAEYDDGTAYSYEIANELINGAFAKFTQTKVISKGDEISTLSVDCALSTEKEVKVSCVADEDVVAFLPKTADLKKRIDYHVFFHEKDLNAPISAGDVLGGVNVYFDGEFVGTARIISANSVEENAFLVFMKDARAFFLSRYFIIFICVLIPSLLIVFFVDFKRRRRSRMKRFKFD